MRRSTTQDADTSQYHASSRELASIYMANSAAPTSFLPVGEEKEDEVLERGWDSANTSEDEEKELAKGMAARYADESSDEEGYLAGGSDDDDDQKERQEYLASLDDDEDAYLNQDDTNEAAYEIAADFT